MRISLFIVLIVGLLPVQAADFGIGNAGEVYEKARQHAFTGRYEAALELYEQLLAEYPDNPDYHLGRGQTLLWMGRPGKAIISLERALELAPAYEDVYRALIQALKADGRHDEAQSLSDMARNRFGARKWLQPVTPPAGTLSDPFSAAGAPSEINQQNWRPALRIDTRIESLDNSPDDWRDQRVELSMSRDQRHEAAVFILNSERFDRSDFTWGLRGVHSLGERLTGLIELSYSPTHRVLPRKSIYGQASYNFGRGWGTLAGVRHVEYSETDVLIGDLTVERYVGSWRFAYTAFLSESDIAGGAVSHRFQGGYFFSNSNLQIAFVTGEEVDKPVDATTVVTTDVKNLSLWGETWILEDFAFTYGFSYTDLEIDGGRESTRKAFNAGFRLRF